ncbi:WhiB family transcriptional regulator [Streptomyces sp. A7024]|uniref:Transcriptional regulator WhiB n=2 Tax=Streptomyces coryli TaxID=1128680 RepID=A0A6G4TVN4_9ACTN|nr:WhiB family transcriptional regulator [Streptomyces coryli]
MRGRSVVVGARNGHLVARPLSGRGQLLAPDPGLSGAACAEVDPELFFPEPGDWRSSHLAKGICAVCPVKDLCLAGALERNEHFGIFGGLSPKERDELRRSGARKGAAA